MKCGQLKRITKKRNLDVGIKNAVMITNYITKVVVLRQPHHILDYMSIGMIV